MNIPRTLITSVMLVVTANAFARIGDTPEQLRERFGNPLREATDGRGSGVRLYQVPRCSELRIRFIDGKSREEVFKLADVEKVPPEFLHAIEQENPGQKIFDNANEVHVRADIPYPEREKRRGGQQTYDGVAVIRDSDKTRWIVLRDGDTVVEIPQFEAVKTRALPVEGGVEYAVTLLDEDDDDMMARLAVVANREHVDWFDCVDHGTLMQLDRIAAGDKVIFDRSVCEIHHDVMLRQSVKLSYGMTAFSPTEEYCMEHFPNHRDYALGGCLGGEAKRTYIYVCPQCVAGCREYRRLHPD